MQIFSRKKCKNGKVFCNDSDIFIKKRDEIGTVNVFVTHFEGFQMYTPLDPYYQWYSLLCW